MIDMIQISEKLLPFAISQKAKDKKFILRSGGKIEAINFIESFFLMIQNGSNTLKAWAETLSFLLDSKETISDVAIQGKLQFRHIDFFVSLFTDVISEQIMKISKFSIAICKYGIAIPRKSLNKLNFSFAFKNVSQGRNFIFTFNSVH